MFIGKILTKNKKFKPWDFFEKSDSFTVDSNIPTLIIGRSLAEDIYGKDKIKVLNKQIENNVYWTFGKTERRVDYEDDVFKFYVNTINRIEKNVDYIYFNIFKETKDNVKYFFRWLYGNDEKYIFMDKNHLYIYYNNIVYGISLEDVNYYGGNKGQVLEKIKNNINNHFIDNTSFLSDEIKKYIKDYKIIVPYLYYLFKN